MNCHELVIFAVIVRVTDCVSVGYAIVVAGYAIVVVGYAIVVADCVFVGHAWLLVAVRWPRTALSLLVAFAQNVTNKKKYCVCRWQMYHVLRRGIQVVVVAAEFTPGVGRCMDWKILL